MLRNRKCETNAGRLQPKLVPPNYHWILWLHDLFWCCCYIVSISSQWIQWLICRSRVTRHDSNEYMSDMPADQSIPFCAIDFLHTVWTTRGTKKNDTKSLLFRLLKWSAATDRLNRSHFFFDRLERLSDRFYWIKNGHLIGLKSIIILMSSMIWNNQVFVIAMWDCHWCMVLQPIWLSLTVPSATWTENGWILKPKRNETIPWRSSQSMWVNLSHPQVRNNTQAHWTALINYANNIIFVEIFFRCCSFVIIVKSDAFAYRLVCSIISSGVRSDLQPPLFYCHAEQKSAVRRLSNMKTKTPKKKKYIWAATTPPHFAFVRCHFC